jgi:alkylated DNA repair dioxygenase AlkB
VAPVAGALVDDELDAYHHASFVSGELHDQLCEFLCSLDPLEVRYRGKPVKTRPKRMWSLKDEGTGAFSLYKWGQEKADYTLVEAMPELVEQLAEKIEFVFGHPQGYLNNAIATVYESGDKQYIPLHQDRAPSMRATGKVEDAAPVYSVSFLATRTFVIADLEHAGKKDRKDFPVIREWPMASGDLVVLKPEVNAAMVHGVPREPGVEEKRVSLSSATCRSTGSAELATHGRPTRTTLMGATVDGFRSERRSTRTPSRSVWRRGGELREPVRVHGALCATERQVTCVAQFVCGESVSCSIACGPLMFALFQEQHGRSSVLQHAMWIVDVCTVARARAACLFECVAACNVYQSVSRTVALLSCTHTHSHPPGHSHADPCTDA